MNSRRPFLSALLLLSLSSHSEAQQSPVQPPSDCITAAAKYHGVNDMLLRAIAWHESKLKPSAVNVNRNGTRDIGALQTNSIHLPELAKYGIGEKDLLNGCVSAFVGAWHLRRHINRYGLTWQAVGAYHSATPELNAKYANAIIAILVGWRVIDSSAPQWRGTATTLSSRASHPSRGQDAAAADDEPSTAVFDRSASGR